MEEDKQQLTDPMRVNEMAPLQNYLQDPEQMATFYPADIVDPSSLNFIPKATWVNYKVTSIQDLHDSYFSRKNSVSRRFEHKLWNCLRLTTVYPHLLRTIGVCWVDDKIIKVYKYPFAKFLAISCVDGGLFHKQGNFTRHGFIDLSDHDVQGQLTQKQLEDVDFKDVHLIMHSQGLFTINSTEESISNCKWVNPAPASRTASLAIVQPNGME